MSVVYAKTEAEKGLDIAEKIDQYDQGWGDTTARVNMLLKNQEGQTSSRSIKIKMLEINHDGDQSLTIFESPNDVKGTAFLSYSHVVTADEQWLYLPAMKRVKRISSANKSGPFMGSQFAFEDLSSFEVEKYNYKYLRDEILDNKNTFVIENYPRYAYSGYTKQIAWIDKERYIPLKINYYDRKNELLKTLVYNDYQQYLGKYWRANEQIMKNHQNQKVTILTWSDYQFKQGLKKRDFKRNVLNRTR